MPPLDRELSDRIADFAADLTALVRQHTVAAVEAKLATRSAQAVVRAALARGRARGAALSARPPGAKRSSVELAATARRLLARIRSHPGERVEQIVKAIGIPTKDLALPIRKLVAGGSIKTTGQRRATRYFPGGGGKASKAAAGGRKRRAGAGKRTRREPKRAAKPAAAE